jgi:hypothetical protein
MSERTPHRVAMVAFADAQVVVYDESVDFDVTRLFSGGIDPKNMPLARDASGCHAVFPHSFIQVNTIFEVVKAAGGRTAWSDKHPAYDLVHGPSGKGVDELYTPEINSEIAKGGSANGVDLAGTLKLCKSSNALPKVTVYTDCIPSQEAYDDVKVQAVVNWIEGKRAEGQRWAAGNGDDEARAPAVFGMNFQAVSVGQKLPVGGYTDAEGTPSANLLDAIAHTDASIGRMVAAWRGGTCSSRRTLADRRRQPALAAGPFEALRGGRAADRPGAPGGDPRRRAARRHHLLRQHHFRRGAGGDLRRSVGRCAGRCPRSRRLHPAQPRRHLLRQLEEDRRARRR